MEHEIVADYRCDIGEGPIWNPADELLYWVDIPDGRLFRYDPCSDRHERCYERDGPIGGVTVQADGSLLLFEEEGRVETWDSGETETVIESIDGEENSRFNDVIADPSGRVFCGTMAAEDGAGHLYRLDTDGTVTRVIESVSGSNGLGFSPDLEHLYYTETGKETIWRYDYDRQTGEISKRIKLIDASDEEGLPDGLTVDAAGRIWSARWDGGCLVRYDEAGNETGRVNFPPRKISSVTFGGKNYLSAFVTSALDGGRRDQEGEGAGAVFRTDVGVRGVPEFRSRVSI